MCVIQPLPIEPVEGSRTKGLPLFPYFQYIGNMESKDAISALAALAHDTRLAVFRLLVQAGEEGMTVGTIAERLKVPNPTLSFHLKELTYAGLVVTEQQGRFISCSANFAAMDSLVGYLTENCCAGASCDLRVLTCIPKKATA